MTAVFEERINTADASGNAFLKVIHAGADCLADDPQYCRAGDGDHAAADALAARVLTNAVTTDMATCIRTARPRVIPVMTNATGRKNAVALAMARHLAGRFGLIIDAGIRMTDAARFLGDIAVGHHYLIVDDFLITGRTLAALRHYITEQGGIVLGAIVMAGPPAMDQFPTATGSNGPDRDAQPNAQPNTRPGARPHAGVQPLTGVRILSVEQYGAGPFGTMYLANQGAEVIKIENPRDGGDMSRAVGPYFLGPDDSEFFHSFNANKRSVTIDLQDPAGQAVFHDLVRTADAVSNNLRGDVPEKLGIDYPSLKTVNPAIVCAHLTAYGRTGSRRSWPGFDYLMQAETGWFSLTGEPDTPPARFGLSVVDMMTGLAMAFAVVAAVVAARESGEGRDMDISLFDLALHNTSYLSTWYLNENVVTERLPRSAHPSLTPCQLYRTGDGWIFLMCNKEKFWPILCEKLDRSDWAADPRFLTFRDRLAQRDLIQQMLDQALSARTTADWLVQFAGAVPSSPIYDIGQAMTNPFVTERGGIQEFPNPAVPGGSFRMASHPVRAAGVAPLAAPAPSLGADTEAVLDALGYGPARRSDLRAKGVI